jgi:photosystem II stability/assembly factor-like uncharacterized protein
MELDVNKRNSRKPRMARTSAFWCVCLAGAVSSCRAGSNSNGGSGAQASDASQRESGYGQGAASEGGYTQDAAAGIRDAQTPDAPDAHVVRACPTSATGAWERITPPAVPVDAGSDSWLGQIAINPMDTTIVYVGTSKHGLFKSTDCGATWTKINTGTGGSALDQGGQWTMTIDPVNPEILYTNSGYGPNGVFKSTDGGVTWAQIMTQDALDAFVDNGFVHEVALDPTDHLHLLVDPHFTCQGSHGAGCIAESRDGGNTWRIIDNAPAGDEQGTLLVVGNTILQPNGGSGLYRSDDDGASFTQTYSGFVQAAIPVLAPGGGVTFFASGQTVLSSADNGQTWTPSNSPGAQGLLAAGKTSVFYGSSAAPGLYATATLSNPTQWTQLPSSPATQGVDFLAYDEDHHILYSSNLNDGFWRLVLQ